MKSWVRRKLPKIALGTAVIYVLVCGFVSVGVDTMATSLIEFIFARALLFCFMLALCFWMAPAAAAASLVISAFHKWSLSAIAAMVLTVCCASTFTTFLVDPLSYRANHPRADIVTWKDYLKSTDHWLFSNFNGFGILLGIIAMFIAFELIRRLPEWDGQG